MLSSIVRTVISLPSKPCLWGVGFFMGGGRYSLYVYSKSIRVTRANPPTNHPPEKRGKKTMRLDLGASFC